MIGFALSWTVLVWILVVTSVTCVLILLAIVVLRSARRLRTRRHERERARVRPAVLGVLAAEDEEDELVEAVDQLRRLPDAQWPAAERYVLQTLSEVRGSSRDALVGVLVDRGTLAAALRTSRGRGAIARARAAEVLGLLQRPEARRRLVSLASDPSRDVRVVAVRALGTLEDPALTETLLAALAPGADVPPSVVGTALLRTRGADPAALRDALSSPHAPVRATAAAVAGHLLVTELAEPISALLDHDPSEAVRSAAGKALARLGRDGDTDDQEVYG
ncbi:HEAT repeat domain-containing protein [Sanguibacter antarcticus]|uniref:HEAT repeat protein n=1 Tax=Sanguibacter antarcticus TaxID=372484 RepID=A0A2A9E5L1_9MICO|nr:HEAT repeat domain-containing protein [Sanguibacter antarcticus]PFG33655.1 HEAT repeat protein [Sanguibacter antarcticus]